MYHWRDPRLRGPVVSFDETHPVLCPIFLNVRSVVTQPYVCSPPTDAIGRSGFKLACANWFPPQRIGCHVVPHPVPYPLLRPIFLGPAVWFDLWVHVYCSTDDHLKFIGWAPNYGVQLYIWRGLLCSTLPSTLPVTMPDFPERWISSLFPTQFPTRNTALRLQSFCRCREHRTKKTSGGDVPQQCRGPDVTGRGQREGVALGFLIELRCCLCCCPHCCPYNRPHHCLYRCLCYWPHCCTRRRLQCSPHYYMYCCPYCHSWDRLITG